MNTEHIIQIAVSVDDDAIKANAMQHCAKEITKCLEDGYISGHNYRHELGYKLVEVIKASCDEFIERHKEEIIPEVVSVLADKLGKRKRFLDITEQDLKEVLTDGKTETN